MSGAIPIPEVYRMVLELAPDPAFLSDFDSARLLDANEAAIGLFGYSREELVKMVGRDLCREDVWPRVHEISAELNKHFRARRTCFPFRTKSGSSFLGDIVITTYVSDGRRFMTMTVRDVTVHVETEADLVDTRQRLSEQAERYRTLVEAADDAILVVDFETARVLEVNQAARAMFGYDSAEFGEIMGRDLLPAEYGYVADVVSRSLNETGRAQRSSVCMKRKDGSRFWTDISMSSYEVEGRHLYVAIIRDATSRIQAELELHDSYRALQATQAKLVHASKMSAMGVLGAGIAHELKQPLTVVQGFCQRILRRPDLPVSQFERELRIVDAETRRMAAIVDNIRRFGRQDHHIRLAPIAAREPLAAALMLLSVQLERRGIGLQEESDADLPAIEGDIAKLQQVFMNLLVNAGDALVEVPAALRAGPPLIELELRVEEEHVLFVVQDNGPGVQPAMRSRLFDPFFTTKPPGEGTGLGLSIAYSIVRDHNGSIACAEREGGGARFEVRIPALAGGAA